MSTGKGWETVLSKSEKRVVSATKRLEENVGRAVRPITTKPNVPNRINPATAALSGQFYRQKANLAGVTVGGEPVHQHGAKRPHQKPDDGAKGRNRRLSNASWNALKKRTGVIV